MGEIADMMINGDMCEMCGEWLEGSGHGYARMCSGCKREERELKKRTLNKPKKNKWIKETPENRP